MADPKKLSGVAVDAAGGPVVDPSLNVIALNEAAQKRQDDLRTANNEYVTSELRAVRGELEALRREATLRAAHQDKLSEKESERIDSIRRVDQQNVSVAAQQALTAIQTLATSSARDAETLRTALANTAATIATQRQGTDDAISKRINILEQSSYEGKGKAGVSDPMLSELLSEMKSLRESRASGTGKTEGINVVWLILVAVAGLVLTSAGLGFGIFMALKK